MPFFVTDIEKWSLRHYEGETCPDDVFIPLDGVAAWQLYPAHRRVYDKLFICESQGLPHGPHGTRPETYPVFSKPIYNLRGMGVEARIVRSEAEYLETIDSGHLWMPI